MSDVHCPARLVCVRHGQGEDNVGGRLVNAVDSHPLTPLGRDQAAAVVGAVTREKIAAVYASPVTRAAETARIIAAGLGLPVTTVDDLREMGLGDWEGLPSLRDGELTESARGVDRVFRGWLDGDLSQSCPGAETGEQMLARLTQALEQIADEHRGETVVVVSHGGSLSLALPLLCRWPSPTALDNCARVVVERDADSWRLISWPGTEP